MFLASFTDELSQHGMPSLRKCAGFLRPAEEAEHLLGRLAVTGALSSSALHGAQMAQAGLSADPYDSPGGSFRGAAVKGVAGGLLAGLGLKLLSRFAKGRVRH